MWLAVPTCGEKVKHRQVVWEGNKYILVETRRSGESNKMEGCCMSYAMGIKRVEKRNVVGGVGGSEGDSGTISIRSEGMSSLSSSVVSMASRATIEEEENNKNDQIKTMKLIKGIVDNEREENKNMKNELKQELAGLARQMSEQSKAQEQSSTHLVDRREGRQRSGNE